jgi:signal transduction histidine kinase
MRRPALKGIRLRLALALSLVVAGAQGIVYLIVVPSLEADLVSAKLDQLEAGVKVAVNGYGDNATTPQVFAEAASTVYNARAVVYTPVQDQLFVVGDFPNTSSLDVERDPIALRAARSGRLQRGTVERGGTRYAEVAVPVEADGSVILLSASLTDPLSSLDLLQRRLLIAGVIGLIFAIVVGYALATMHARRIRRLDRARSEFIANASHELRTPLFSLGGFLELMADEDVDEKTRREFLETMGEQVERLAKLATDLLDLSRLDAGRMRVEHEPVDLGEIVQAVAEEFRGVAERSRHPIEVVVEGRPVARADELRVLQVARALADNAFVHTPEGTPIRLRAYADREHAYLEVGDEGLGVPAEHTPHVFDRFYRADGGVASGSGLGLAITRELVTVMDGDVVLESKPGRTVVRVVLGAAPTSVPAPEATERVFT